jgi:hypothetical protein
MHCAMWIRNPYVRMCAAFVATVFVGAAIWFEWDARLDGFSGHFDRRAAHGAGIIASSEWKSMRAAGDTAPVAKGGSGCTSDACRSAQAQVGGLWRGITTCADGDRYTFTDSAVEITSHSGGTPAGVVRRSYRLVVAPVTLRLLRDGTGASIERSVTKLPGDVEVFTVGRSSYVRRIFRAADSQTLRLILVEQRARQAGPAQAMYVEGKPTTGGGSEVAYTRCP